MFCGEFSTTIDSKGRTSVPAKYREIIVEVFGDERLFITKCLVDIDGRKVRGLTAYPHREFMEFTRGIHTQGYTATQIDFIQRLVVGPAQECTVDKQGRVLIPPSLRAYAGLDRDLVVVGTENKIEIWGQDAWAQVEAKAEDVYLTARDGAAVSGS